MTIKERAKGLGGFISEQGRGYWEQGRLKLRILAFSNKLNSLHEKFGELVYRNLDDLEGLFSLEEFTKLKGQIDKTIEEMNSAKKGLDEGKSASSERSAQFLESDRKLRDGAQGARSETGDLASDEAAPDPEQTPTEESTSTHGDSRDGA